MATTQVKEGEYTTTIYGMVSFLVWSYHVLDVIRGFDILLTSVAREQREILGSQLLNLKYFTDYIF